MTARPNPLTDELSPEAKAELAAVFAALKEQFGPLRLRRSDRPHTLLQRSARRPWELR